MNQENENIKEELEQLRIENLKLKEDIENSAKSKNKFYEKSIEFSTWIFAGPNLFNSLKKWFEELQNKEVSTTTTANLFAALTRRIIKIGIWRVIILIIAAIPSLSPLRKVTHP